MITRLLSRAGRYVDELFFGEQSDREVGWCMGVFLVAVVGYIGWQLLR
jgi:hypothetical protein